MFKNLDKENMFNAIWEFPDNLSEANRLGENIKLRSKLNAYTEAILLPTLEKQAEFQQDYAERTMGLEAIE